MVGSEIGGGGRGRAKSPTTSDRDRQRSRSCRNLSDRCAFDPDLLRLLSDAVNPDDSESLDGTTFPSLRRPRSLACETRREVEGETYSDDEVNRLLTERQNLFETTNLFEKPNGTIVHVESGTYGVVVDWKEVVDHYSNADSSYYEVRLSPNKCCRVLMWSIRV